MFGKGFFRAGFTGWYRGLVSVIIPGRPGTLKLGSKRADLGINYVRATAGLNIGTGSLMLDMATAETVIGAARASLTIGME